MTFKDKCYEIIFESDTSLGKLFDLVLIVFIIVSSLIVMLESVASIRENFSSFLFYAEWFFTIIFTIEFLLRIYSSKESFRYIFSFFGFIDFVSVLPSYIGIFIPGGHYFIVLRTFRVLRVFRILKLVKFIHEAKLLAEALIASQRKIIIFLFFVLALVTILGSFMYLIESPEAGFTSIPKSIYWAVVTLTTVGYGDISPRTALGQFVSSMIMILGYVIIAVPTGIVTTNLLDGKKENKNDREENQKLYCIDCQLSNHLEDALFCRKCGKKLDLFH